MADQLAQRGCLLRGTYQAVETEHLRLLGACFDQIGDAEPVAGSVEITVVI